MRTPQQIHDELLVLQSQSGESQALAELLRGWHERLLNLARRMVWNEADALDALQEALIAIARTIRRLDDPALFGPWARRILAHKCADAVRRRRQQQRLARDTSTQQPPPTQNHQESDHEESIRVRLAIDQLPLESQALLVMRYARDMSTQQIAAALHIREGTVKSRLHHARNQLKSILERNT